MSFTFVDLFAGAGGLSEGFMQEGFTDIAHVEMVQDACNTIKTRNAFHYCKKNGKLDLYYERLKNAGSSQAAIDLWNSLPEQVTGNVICQTMSNDNLEETFDLIKKATKGREIDFVIGGPPCQAYSIIGRSTQKDGMENDPRNHLYKIYFEYIKEFQPKAFVFENVTGIFTAGRGKYLKDIIKTAKGLGYQINIEDIPVLNARDFGVLQNRQRVIIFGCKETEYQEKFRQNLDLIKQAASKKFSKFIVNDLLSDLPKLNIGKGIYSSDKYLTDPTEYLLASKIRNKDVPLSQFVTRPIREVDREIYRIAIAKWNKGIRLDYQDLPEKLRFHKRTDCFTDRFKVVEGNRTAAHTMVAHISKDGHYYIHPDIEQARSLAVREAARIQSFPDDYFFEGSRTACFTQIGNAVPPMLSIALAKAVLKTYKK